MEPHERPVALVGGDLDGAPHGVLQPAFQVFFEGEAPGVEVEAPVPVGQGLGKLLSGVGVALSVDDLALPPGGGLDP